MSTGQFTEAQVAHRAREEGYEWLALELDDYGNAARWPAFRDACHAEALMSGPWFTNGDAIARTPDDAEFVIAECEGPGDYDGIVREQGGVPDGLPRAILTNFSTPLRDPDPNPAAAKVLIDGGWRCLTECYMGENPNATPDRLDFTAKQLGWPSSQPCFGVYGGATLDTYAEWASWPGASVYLAEYLW